MIITEIIKKNENKNLKKKKYAKELFITFVLMSSKLLTSQIMVSNVQKVTIF